MASSPTRTRSSQDEQSTEAARRGKKTTAEMVADNKGPGFVGSVVRFVIGLAIVLAIGAVLFFVASAIEGDDPSPLAPWNDNSAPDVRPSTLEDQ